MRSSMVPSQGLPLFWLSPHRSTITSYSCFPLNMMGKKWICAPHGKSLTHDEPARAWLVDTEVVSDRGYADLAAKGLTCPSGFVCVSCFIADAHLASVYANIGCHAHMRDQACMECWRQRRRLHAP